MRRSKNLSIITSVIMSILFILIISACKKDSENLNTNDDGNLPEITGYPIVGTNQTVFFNNNSIIAEPTIEDDFYGQNANYPGNIPSYTNNGDGTVTDNITGLMWQSSFDHNGDGKIDYSDKLTYNQLIEIAPYISTAGYTDWRVPTIKEQYSLIVFSGRDISGYEGSNTDDLIPFINTEAFDFAYGDLDAGERLIDVQCATTNVYVDRWGMETMVFGVNFADGRIKGYGTTMMGMEKAFNYLLVRGNTNYGINDFIDNADGTVSDIATGLMWMQSDNGLGMNWQEALAYAESYEFAGYDDWRLPDAKELHSLLDYSRSPGTTGTAAIDPLFSCTEITNEAGQIDFPWYWSSTTHGNWTNGNEGAWGAYVCFGRALGNMNGWVDVHGAGAQRSDPKAGDPAQYSEGHGPQGDAVRIYNYVRLVRNIK